MKFVFPFLLFLFVHNQCASQLISVKYYNKNWQTTNKNERYYKREIYKENDSLFIIKDYYRNDSIEMIGQYSSVDKHLKNGLFTFFYASGNKHYSGHYCNGLICGKWLVFDQAGNISDTVNYNFTPPVCSPFDTSYNSYLKRDSLNYVIVDYMPHFVYKDFKTFKDYVQASLFIPPLINKYKIKDRAEAKFTVDINGNLCNIEVTSLYDNKTIIKEVTRILVNSPKWK
ncbi:MAG: hypothetical protein GXO79_10315, partial [Chlorobi bacterium]|nr:hypothetical protein [Chlorobiota bacterium]